MKKQLSLFGWAATVFGLCALIAPMSAGIAATNSGAGGASVSDLSSGASASASASASAAASNAKVQQYKKYETRTSTATYTVKPTPAPAQAQTLYYTAPSRTIVAPQAVRVAPAGAPALQSARSETVKEVSERKYYLAHPFYQPTEGCFNSLTDLGYTMNSYNFAITSGFISRPDGTMDTGFNGISGKWSGNQFSVKEDLSYGISDTVAIIGSARYALSKYEFDWNEVTLATDTTVDKASKNGFDVVGGGLQWRFYDGPEWIAYIGGYYQWWKDLSNTLVADAKVGYKVAPTTTIYGLGRVYYMMWDENSYGNGITDKNGNVLFIAYEHDVDSSFYIEGGLGAFTVLAKDWTLNLEGVIGDYAWHTQGSIKGAIGWQPTNNFALNLYAKTAVFDTANNAKGLQMYAWNPANVVQWAQVPSFQGDVSLSKYRETTFGVQLMLQF